MDLLKENSSLTIDEKLKFETINLAYKSDATENHLQLKNGNLTLEQNCKLNKVFFNSFFLF